MAQVIKSDNDLENDQSTAKCQNFMEWSQCLFLRLSVCPWKQQNFLHHENSHAYSSCTTDAAAINSLKPDKVNMLTSLASNLQLWLMLYVYHNYDAILGYAMNIITSYITILVVIKIFYKFLLIFLFEDIAQPYSQNNGLIILLYSCIVFLVYIVINFLGHAKHF